jgi:sugar lactone lactonase YvrE
VDELSTSVVAEGFVFGEGPRWHDGRLWFSDMAAGEVLALGEGGELEVVLRTPHPSGLGWSIDGTLLVAVLFSPRILRVDDGEASLAHDLSDHCWATNDMVMGPDGVLYVDLYTNERGAAPSGGIGMVTPEGEVRAVASGLGLPNGLAITADRSTLVASDTERATVWAFAIDDDGGLSGQRVFADLGHRRPDGLCVDEEGAAWVGCHDTHEFLRVLDGGEVTHRVATPGALAVAPALGGPDRRTLYLVANETTVERARAGDSKGRIEQVRVDVPGAGWP